MGVPGWPELACWTASMERVRIVLIASWSSSASVMALILARGRGGEEGADPWPIRWSRTFRAATRGLAPFDPLILLLLVPSELIAHGGEQLVGEVGLAARAEALVEGGGEHVGGNALVDCRLDGPAALPGIGHPACELRQ